MESTLKLLSASSCESVCRLGSETVCKSTTQDFLGIACRLHAPMLKASEIYHCRDLNVSRFKNQLHTTCDGCDCCSAVSGDTMRYSESLPTLVLWLWLCGFRIDWRWAEERNFVFRLNGLRLGIRCIWASHNYSPTGRWSTHLRREKQLLRNQRA